MNVLCKILYSELLLTAVGFSQGQLAVTPSAIAFLSDETGTNVSSSSCQSFSGVCFVTVTSTGGPLSFSAFSSAAWLSVNPTTSTTPGYVTFSLQFPNNHMNVGTYSGTITLTSKQATNSPLRVPVTLTVVNPTLVVSPANLTFNAAVGGTRIYQSIALTSTTSPSLEVTYNATVLTGTPWLSLVGQTGGATPAALSVGVNPSGLAIGTYNGSIAATPIGGTQIVVPVTMTITTPTITVSPPQLSFAYQIGAPIPSSQILQISGTSGATFTVHAATNSGGNWLLVSPNSGSTPAAISVSVSPLNLPVGSYQGTITVSGNGASSSTVVAIGLIVTAQAPIPTLYRILNAASFMGQAISPGELVSIFGEGIGPLTALTLQLDSTGKVSTSLGGVQVLFGGAGYLAPLTYVSSTQINCVVPYEIAGIPSPSVQVKYAGQVSNVVLLTSAPTAPGMFTTANEAQAAALNQDGSANGPAHPEAAGNIVSIFMTGEGQTSPPGITGSITCKSGCNTLQQIPVPLQPVTALVGNQPAKVTFYGEAPSLVAGVLQVNLVIPPNTPSGAVPLIVSVGGVQSQADVYFSVK